ncbi:MAG: hypothetical protein M3Z25_20550, partial [Actinomycetota bacterium]|nr:hypothetical protein [Actinomycetota bacterium]
TGVAVDVADDSGGRGTLVVVLTPSGADTHPSDTRTRVSATALPRSGGELWVTASSAGGPVPYRDRLDQLVRALAGRL